VPVVSQFRRDGVERARLSSPDLSRSANLLSGKEPVFIAKLIPNGKDETVSNLVQRSATSSEET
jgi:hypothetical protein